MAVAVHSYEAALAQIAGLKKARPDLESVLQCYEAIYRAQSETRDAFRPRLKGLDEARCSERQSDGKPFVDPDSIQLDRALFADVAGRIGQIVQRQAQGSEVAGSLLPDLSKLDDRALLKGVLDGGAALDSMVQQTGGTPQMLAFLGTQSLLPFMEAHAMALRGHIDESVWTEGHCPVCGGKALMARLDSEAGKRYLQCCLCRTDWAFGRVECPFCGNTEQETLRYFSDEEDDVYRVEVCDVCKTYMKTVDMRKADGDAVVAVEYLATLHLDVVAQREGFRSEMPGFVGL